MRPYVSYHLDQAATVDFNQLFVEEIRMAQISGSPWFRSGLIPSTIRLGLWGPSATRT